MSTLDQLGIKYSTGKSSMMCNYLSFYELLIPEQPGRRLLEIGIQFGNSAKMWREYFGPECKIIGIDSIDNGPTSIEALTQFYLGDACSQSMIDNVSSHGPYYFIVDDGSHALSEQQFVVANYPRILADSGILIIEDVASMAFAYKLVPSVPADCNHATVKLTDLPDTILFLVWKKQS